MNRADLKKLTEMRVEDARSLLTARRYNAARYLAGYAVECALKACVARKTKKYDFVEHGAERALTHSYDLLLKASPLNQ